MEIEDDNQHKVRNVQDSIQPPRQPRNNYKKLRIIAALALLLMISASGFVTYNTAYRPYALHLQQTALVQTRIGRMLSAHATHAAIIGATATAVVAATATIQAVHQSTYNLIAHTTPIINDNLRNPDSYNWDTGAGCSFVKATYTATVTQKGFFLPCLAKHAMFSNFAYQVDMKILQGDAGGLIVRADAANTQSYLFVVDQDGTYSIYYYSGSAKQRAKTLKEGYSSSIINGAGKENRLGVIASGTSLDFYINSKYITSIVDEHRSSGLIGVLANNYTNTTSVRYSRAEVWKL